MTLNTTHSVRLTLCIGFLAAGSIALAGPLGAGFTYQGQLKDAGVTADGEFDFKFRLYDSTSTQVGGEINFEFVQVTDGLFTVELDFGAGVFTGDALWLEIDVRMSGSGDPFATLSPRQPLTAAPFAMYALSGPGGEGTYWQANGSAIMNSNTGFVGVNRSDTVSGAEYFGIQAPVSSGYGGMYIRTDGDAGWPFYGYKSGTGDVAWTYLDGATGNWKLYNDGVRMTVTDTGNVGIGVTDPTAKLDVEAASDYAISGESFETTGGAGVFGRGRYGVYGFANTLEGFGGVFGGAGGFGSGPALWSVGDALVSGGLRIGSAGAFDAATVKLQVENGTDASPTAGGFVVVGSTDSVNIAIDNNEIMARDNGVPSTLYLNNNGGIVRVPVLEIVGADVAEKFPVSEEIEPGTVVEIDPDNPGKLRVACGAYNRRVAGVASGAGDIPVGTILGNLPGSEDSPAIALSGRVWVRCDASRNAIETGDLLTTSDTAGHAMAVSDFSRAHGTVIGKAMTPLAEGETGLVLVLVNLQ